MKSSSQPPFVARTPHEQRCRVQRAGATCSGHGNRRCDVQHMPIAADKRDEAPQVVGDLLDMRSGVPEGFEVGGSHASIVDHDCMSQPTLSETLQDVSQQMACLSNMCCEVDRLCIFNIHDDGGQEGHLSGVRCF